MTRDMRANALAQYREVHESRFAQLTRNIHLYVGDAFESSRQQFEVSATGPVVVGPARQREREAHLSEARDPDAGQAAAEQAHVDAFDERQQPRQHLEPPAAPNAHGLFGVGVVHAPGASDFDLPWFEQYAAGAVRCELETNGSGARLLATPPQDGQ